MLHTFVSWPDAFEEDPDRLGVKFASKVGYFWVRRERVELVEQLRRGLQTGEPLEITYDPSSLEIQDVVKQ
jgi:hypothetical protein